jgi:hypothetical protein
MMTKTQLITISSLSLFLSGCGPVALSEITKDKKTYMNQHFSAKVIPQAVLNKIPREASTKTSGDTKMFFETKTIASDKTTSEKEVHHYSRLDNGLFQNDIEFLSNDIVNGYNFTLVYKGLYDVKWMYTSSARAYAGAQYELKEIKRWDALGVNPGDVSVVDFRWGTEVAITNFDDGQYKCTVSKTADAKEINPKLTGKARYLDCEKSKNGVTFSYSKRAYLTDLEFAIPIELKTANYRFEYKLVDVQSQ